MIMTMMMVGFLIEIVEMNITRNLIKRKVASWKIFLIFNN